MTTTQHLAPATEAAWRTGLGHSAASLVATLTETAPTAVTGTAAHPWIRLEQLLGDTATLTFGQVTIVGRGRA